MALYEKTMNTIVLQTTWRCASKEVNGAVTWYISEGPYADGNTVVFPVSIPRGA